MKTAAQQQTRENREVEALALAAHALGLPPPGGRAGNDSNYGELDSAAGGHAANCTPDYVFRLALPEQSVIDARLKHNSAIAARVPNSWAEAKNLLSKLIGEIRRNEDKITPLRPESKLSAYFAMDTENRATLASIALIYPEHVLVHYKAWPNTIDGLWLDETLLQMTPPHVQLQDPLYDLLRIARVAHTVMQHQGKRADRPRAVSLVGAKQFKAILNNYDTISEHEAKVAFCVESEEHAWTVLKAITDAKNWGDNAANLALVTEVLEGETRDVFLPFCFKLLDEKHRLNGGLTAGEECAENMVVRPQKRVTKAQAEGVTASIPVEVMKESGLSV